jgi:hypothetical protein
MMKLFNAPHARSLASHIALEEAAATYTTVRVDFAEGEQREPEYLAINLQGRVPACREAGKSQTTSRRRPHRLRATLQHRLLAVAAGTTARSAASAGSWQPFPIG